MIRSTVNVVVTSPVEVITVTQQYNIYWSPSHFLCSVLRMALFCVMSHRCWVVLHVRLVLCPRASLLDTLSGPDRVVDLLIFVGFSLW